MRAAATLVTTLAMSLAAIGLAVAAPGGDPRIAAATLQSASGAVTIANSHGGGAIFSAGGVRPGGSASGTVRISNAGDVAGGFALDVPDVRDAPGPYGGRLSERVVLVIADVTAGSPVTLFVGHPAELSRLSLGTLEAGAQREYRFTVALPAGAGDNAYQGAGLSLGFVWLAGPLPAVAAPTPAPVVTPAPPAPTVSAQPVDYASAIGLPPAKTCVRGGRLKLKLKAPDRSTLTSVTVAVNGRTTVRAQGARARRPITLRGLRKSSAVKVTARTSKRGTYTATRTYRACR
jgi:hypothetical protein